MISECKVTRKIKGGNISVHELVLPKTKSVHGFLDVSRYDATSSCPHIHDGQDLHSRALPRWIRGWQRP